MKKTILISILLNASVFSEENIFDQIRNYSGPAMGKIPIDNTNPSLKASLEHVKELPKPWTVANLISLYDDPKYSSYRKDILIMLMASGDDKGCEFLGRFIERLNNHSTVDYDIAGDVLRLACLYYVKNYPGGGSEQEAFAVTAWWKEFKEIKQNLVKEKWQIEWENTENKDKLPIEAMKAIATELAKDDLEKTKKSIAQLKEQGAVNALILLLKYPNDSVIKAVAESLSDFPTKEVATALYESLKTFDTALAGGTDGAAAQDQAIAAVTNSLFKGARIDPSPDFANHEKRNQAIEQAINKMTSQK